VTSPDAGNAARILLAGKEGAIGLMPPLASALSDEQIAAVLTTSDGNGATPHRQWRRKT
jgi:mono/diheme cytochrome c family protein